MLAMNAKASVTPPNWARTPDAETTRRRSSPLGDPVTIAYESRAPSEAPRSAVTAETKVVSIVADFSIAACRTGRARPAIHRFWPVSEYRYSSHSRAAAGCGADLLIAWA